MARRDIVSCGAEDSAGRRARKPIARLSWALMKWTWAVASKTHMIAFQFIRTAGIMIEAG